MSGWKTNPGYGKAIYPFKADGPGQLALEVGDEVEIKQEHAGWYRGYLKGKPGPLMIFPVSYIDFTPMSLDVLPPALPPMATTPTSGIRAPNTPSDGSQPPSFRPMLTPKAPPSTTNAAATSAPPSSAPTPTATLSADTQPKLKAQASVAGPSSSVKEVLALPTVHYDCRDTVGGFFIPAAPEGYPYDDSNAGIVELIDAHRLADASTAMDNVFEVSATPQSSLEQLRLQQHQLYTTADLQASALAPNSSNTFPHTLSRVGTFTSASTASGAASSLSTSHSHTHAHTSATAGHAAGDFTVSPKKLQLYLDVKVCIFSVGEDTELLFSLYSRNRDKNITENFVVNLPPPGQPEHSRILGRMKTIFSDLDPSDLKDELWLVCRIYRRGVLLYDPKEVKDLSAKPSAGSTTRRCFGCAATCITSANLTSMLGREYQPPPANLTIYTPTVETNFPQFHKTLVDCANGLVRDREKEMEPAPRAKGIALGLTLFEGNLAELRTQHRTLQGVGETPALGFPRLWDPTVPRNDLYVHLRGGSFSQDKKSSARNIEVRVKLVRNADYSEVPNAMVRGSGEEPLSQYCSSVYYHSNNPNLDETFKVCVPAAVLNECHLLLEFWHVSTTAKKSAVFSNAYLCLTADNGRIVADDQYSVQTYKPWGKGDHYLSDESKCSPRGETFTVGLQLASTVLTQNTALTLLSQWKIQSKPALLSTLQQLVSRAQPLPVSQLAPFAGELLNVLLSILSNAAYTDLHSVTFQALVHTIARLSTEYYPVLHTYALHASEASAFPRLLALTASAFTSAVKSAISVAAATPAAPTTPTEKGPEKGKLPRKSLPAGSFDESQTAGSVRGFTRLQPEEEDDGALLRLMRALPILITLCSATFLAQEKKNAAVASAAAGNFRAPPPVAASASTAIPLDLTRAGFNEHLASLFATGRELVAADIEDKPKHLVSAQSQYLTRAPALFWDLTHSLAAVLTPAEAIDHVAQLLDSAARSPHLAVDRLLVLKAVLTGVAGPLHPPPSAFAAADKCGLTGALTSWSRAWACAHPATKRRALSGPELDRFLPLVVEHVGAILTDAVARKSLAEPYLATIVLQHVYTRTHANENTTTAYAQLFPHNDDPEQPSARGIDGSSSGLSALFGLIPALSTTLHMLFCAHPAIPLPKDTRERPQLQLPPTWLMQLSFVDILQDLAALWAAIVLAAGEDALPTVLRALPRDVLPVTVQRLLFVATRILPLIVFPGTWLAPSMLPARAAICVLRSLCPVLRAELSGPHFCAASWCAWLALCLDVRECSLLDNENMPVARRVVISERHGDLRAGVSALLDEMWGACTDQDKVRTAYLLVERLLATVASAGDASLCVCALDMYFALLVAQYRTNGDFAEIERHSIDALYEITNESTEAGARCMERVRAATMARFESAGVPDMRAAGVEFLDHMKTLFTLMSSLFAYPDEPQYEDDRTSIALRLIEYIERTGHSASTRKAMHTRYVQYLVDLHSHANNHVEAGIAQLQQARMLDWADTPLDAFAGHPAEPERARKERLLRSAIVSFVRGEDWERAIERADYLRFYYQQLVFDYGSLAEVLADQAIYFTKVLHVERFYSNYFRVCFYGSFDDEALTQPQSDGVAMGEYVYKGRRLESLMDFTNRLKQRFPDAHFHMASDRPSADVLKKHPRVVAIAILAIPPADLRANVLTRFAADHATHAALLAAEKPYMERWAHQHSAFTAHSPAASPTAASSASSSSSALVAVPASFTATPAHVTKYRDNDNICVFEYSRPWRRTAPGVAASTNEFSDLWLVRTYIVTAESFPSTRRRVPVVGRVEEVVQPIATAVEAVQKKTRELELIMRSVQQQHGSRCDVGPLSMCLNGMIDAAVNGGTNKYIEAFLTPEFISPSAVVLDDEKADLTRTLAERRRLQTELRASLRAQIAVLQDALDLFGQKCDDKLRGLYEHLCGFFTQMIVKTAAILE